MLDSCSTPRLTRPASLQAHGHLGTFILGRSVERPDLPCEDGPMSQEESEVEQHARDRLGTTIRDKYRLDRILGTGGMAVVYSATHRNKKQFALKMLHRELSVHQTIRSRFLREGYAANSFKHGGVVAVLDDDVAEDGRHHHGAGRLRFRRVPVGAVPRVAAAGWVRWPA